MRESAISAWVEYNDDLEGICFWMYLDQIGLVTTGMGLLINSTRAALSLPWKRPDGSRASRAEIEAEWHKVAAMTDLAGIGGGNFAAFTTLRLTKADVAASTARKLRVTSKILRQHYPDWDSWPADAHLAAASVAWAVGSIGSVEGYPKMRAALLRGDFDEAAKEATFRDPTVGTYGKRQAKQQLCFQNAAKVTRNAGDPERLWWPEVAPEEPVTDPATPEAIEHRGGGAMAIEGIVDGLGKGKGWRPGED